MEDRDEGEIYLAKVYGKSVVVKTSYKLECLIYEFLVGEQVNSLHSKNFPETLGIYLLPNKDRIKPYEEYIPHLLLEYVQGKTLDNYIHMSENSLLLVFYQLICILQLAQEQIEFTHYDLHSGNIIIEKSHIPVTLEYNLKRGKKILKTKTIVHIIDFGYSHVKLPVVPKNCLVCLRRLMLDIGIVPSVFDPLGDFLYLSFVAFLSDYIQLNYGSMGKDTPSVKIYKWARSLEKENNLQEGGGEDLSICLNKIEEITGDTFIYPKNTTPMTKEEYCENMKLFPNMKLQDQLFSNYKLYLVGQRKTKDLYSTLDFLLSLISS